jgi:hypothetical protein
VARGLRGRPAQVASRCPPPLCLLACRHGADTDQMQMEEITGAVHVLPMRDTDNDGASHEKNGIWSCSTVLPTA